MFDPFQMGLMTLAGANNPELLSTAMASQGISPSVMASGPNATNPFQANNLGALLQPGQLPTPMSPEQAGMKDPAAQPGMAASGLGALSGVKAPEPIKPVFNAGVSGAQRAPEVQVKAASGGSQAIDMLMRQLMGAGAGVPNLATLLKGVG